MTTATRLVASILDLFNDIRPLYLFTSPSDPQPWVLCQFLTHHTSPASSVVPLVLIQSRLRFVSGGPGSRSRSSLWPGFDLNFQSLEHAQIPHARPFLPASAAGLVYFRPNLTFPQAWRLSPCPSPPRDSQIQRMTRCSAASTSEEAMVHTTLTATGHKPDHGAEGTLQHRHHPNQMAKAVPDSSLVPLSVSNSRISSPTTRPSFFLVRV